MDNEQGLGEDLMKKTMIISLWIVMISLLIIPTTHLDMQTDGILAMLEEQLASERNLMNRKIETSLKSPIAATHLIVVSKSGNDLYGDGSLNKPYATIQHAINMASKGDSILVREGTYFESIVFTKSGTFDHFITLTNYPGENPILDGSLAQTEAMISLNGQSYIHIEGFKICHLKGDWAYGFLLNHEESHVIIRHNELYDIKTSNVKDANNGANAIICFGASSKKSIQHILIENNYIHDCETGWSEAVSITGNCEYINVIHNRIEKTGNIGIDFSGNYGYCPNKRLDQARLSIVKDNTISYCNSPNATSYGLYIDGGRDIIVENNTIFNSQGGIEIAAEERSIYPTTNILVRNNLIYHNQAYGLLIGAYQKNTGRVENIKVYNNTLINNGLDENMNYKVLK